MIQQVPPSFWVWVKVPTMFSQHPWLSHVPIKQVSKVQTGVTEAQPQPQKATSQRPGITETQLFHRSRTLETPWDRVGEYGNQQKSTAMIYFGQTLIKFPQFWEPAWYQNLGWTKPPKFSWEDIKSLQLGSWVWFKQTSQASTPVSSTSSSSLRHLRVYSHFQALPQFPLSRMSYRSFLTLLFFTLF